MTEEERYHTSSRILTVVVIDAVEQIEKIKSSLIDCLKLSEEVIISDDNEIFVISENDTVNTYNSEEENGQ